MFCVAAIHFVEPFSSLQLLPSLISALLLSGIQACLVPAMFGPSAACFLPFRWPRLLGAARSPPLVLLAIYHLLQLGWSPWVQGHPTYFLSAVVFLKPPHVGSILPLSNTDVVCGHLRMS
eukprot:GHVS01063952.1.p2 GENE.GHVS01063952.1~~GHVS01063952.1.p2  ORF type:complete len:120 (-),score=15.38 GHVS01063952.1:377-736(-)